VKLYFRILAYLRPYTVLFMTAVASLFLFAAFDIFSIALFIPFIRALFNPGAVAETGNSSIDQWMTAALGRFIDLEGDPQVAVQGIIVFILVTFLLKNLFSFIGTYLVARVDQAVTRDIRREVYNHLLNLDLGFFGRTRMGQIISRLTHDIEQLRRLVTKELAKVISSGFEFIAAVILMGAISWRLTLAAFIVLPGMFLIWGPLLRRLKKRDRRVLNLAGDVNSHIQETLAGIRLVKSSSAEAHERKRFHDLTGRYYRQFVRTETLRALAGPVSEMLAAAGTAILLWYGTRLVVSGGALSSEAFLVFIAGSTKLYSPVKYLSKLPTVIQPGLVGAERVFEFMDTPVEIRDRDGAIPFRGLDEGIRFEGVSFAYRAGTPVVQDIDVSVPAGSMVALVGPSGAGKTTLVDLLGRFYEVSEGRITIDGHDIREFQIQSLRGSLGIVSQDTVLFHDSVRNNIAYGAEGVSDEAVREAARLANADGFIRELPQGYDTLVGERGTDLSGGQRQRIAIARAILRDPPILIFDEATSALDTESERLVQAATERLLEGRTVFVIAHRLSTIQRADLILVMQEGRLVERGTHSSLLASGGLYRKLYDLQFSDDQSVEGPGAEGPGVLRTPAEPSLEIGD
jgi:subfamily B ATP-binding cassette protein MsbA